MTNKANNGVVFTQEWVVELILDCCGYDSARDLGGSMIIEPSFGQGAFLIPIVRRLLASAKKYNHEAKGLADSIRAFELNSKDIKLCREKLSPLLEEFGASKEIATDLLGKWLVHEDYLLCHPSKCADFVVGNPPYIRATEIDRHLREQYVKSCQTMTAGTDIYIGFIETGMKHLRPNGVLCFICADRWMHNAYGKKLRKLVSQKFSVDMVFQMHSVNAFQSKVSAYPAVIRISNTAQGEVAFATMNESFSRKSVRIFQGWLAQSRRSSYSNEEFSGHWLPDWFKTDDAWPFASPESIVLLEKLNTHYHPLQDNSTNTLVGIGIATGRDDVFIITDSTLVEKCLLLPLVTSEQMRNGLIERKNVWLFNPWDSNGNLINIEQYPLAKAYLLQKQDELRSRHVVKKSKTNGWYRTIDKVYPELTNKPKLLIQDIKSAIQPVFDKGEYYPHHNLYWITSERWNLEVLGGLLISDVVRTIVEAYCVKMRGGTLRLQAQYLRKIRLPNPDTIDTIFQEKLIQAFRDNDRDEANKVARIVYNLERISA